MAPRTIQRMVQRTVQRRDPERTRARILDAAKAEFAERGLGGARVDRIARLSGANKRMLYHYFGSKQDLFLAVLEDIYEEMRRDEAALHLEAVDPQTAIHKLVDFYFAYYVERPYFIRLLNSENLHKAEHVKRSPKVRGAAGRPGELHAPVINLIADLLRRGKASGVFRGDADPMQLYISIAALGYFYFSSIHTLSVAYGKDLASKSQRLKRRRHVAEVILGYLRP